MPLHIYGAGFKGEPKLNFDPPIWTPANYTLTVVAENELRLDLMQGSLWNKLPGALMVKGINVGDGEVRGAVFFFSFLFLLFFFSFSSFFLWRCHFFLFSRQLGSTIAVSVEGIFSREFCCTIAVSVEISPFPSVHTVRRFCIVKLWSCAVR